MGQLQRSEGLMDEIAIRDYFERAHGMRSALGDLDCVRFTIEGIFYGWGIDYREILGYQDRRTAIDRLRIAGGLQQAFTDELGDPVDVDELLPGDIAYFDDPAVGLVMPGYIAVKYRSTIFRAPRQFARCGWHSWVQR